MTGCRQCMLPPPTNSPGVHTHPEWRRSCLCSRLSVSWFGLRHTSLREQSCFLLIKDWIRAKQLRFVII